MSASKFWLGVAALIAATLFSIGFMLLLAYGGYGG